MKLTELEPRWIHPNVFVFKCPHCRRDWLACKNIVMPERDQWALFESVFGEWWNVSVVPMDVPCAWSIAGTDFATMTVAPSIDASKSGHWHGHITNGEIIP